MLAYLLEHWVNILGTIGVVMVLWTYLSVQIGRMKIEQFSYSLVNLLGSLFVLVSLFYHFNLSSFIIEIAWTLISVYGIYKYIKLNNTPDTTLHQTKEIP